MAFVISRHRVAPKADTYCGLVRGMTVRGRRPEAEGLGELGTDG